MFKMPRLPDLQSHKGMLTDMADKVNDKVHITNFFGAIYKK